jgi:hypothetical protein
MLQIDKSWTFQYSSHLSTAEKRDNINDEVHNILLTVKTVNNILHKLKDEFWLLLYFYRNNTKNMNSEWIETILKLM